MMPIACMGEAVTQGVCKARNPSAGLFAPVPYATSGDLSLRVGASRVPAAMLRDARFRRIRMRQLAPQHEVAFKSAFYESRH